MLPDLITGPGTTLAGVQVIGHELLSRAKNEENKKFDSWQLCFKLIGPGSWLAPLRTTGRTPIADFHFSIAPPPLPFCLFHQKMFRMIAFGFFLLANQSTWLQVRALLWEPFVQWGTLRKQTQPPSMNCILNYGATLTSAVVPKH